MKIHLTSSGIFFGERFQPVAPIQKGDSYSANLDLQCQLTNQQTLGDMTFAWTGWVLRPKEGQSDGNIFFLQIIS